MSPLRNGIAGLLICLGLCRSVRGAEAALDPPLQKLREQAQQCYDAGDTENGHLAMAGLVAAIPPGRVELATELLGTMRRASMRDRRMNRWTAYAAERLVALHQAGLLDENNSEVPDAYDCLCVVRWDQGRLWESWITLQQLLALDLDNPYVRLAPLRLLAQVDSPAMCPLMLSILDTVDGSRTDDKTRKWLMVADRIVSQPQDFEHIPMLDPWRPIFSRAKFWEQSNQEMLDDLKSAMTRRIAEQQAQAWTNPPPAPAPAALPALRQVHEIRYQERIRAGSPAQRARHGVLACYRESPWALTANQDLLGEAQVDLQHGRIAAARRSFGDILQYALDTATRQAAQVGLWLAAASENEPAALEALFADVEPGTLFTWMGKKETASVIQARLLKGMPVDDRSWTPLAGLQPRLLRLPAVPAWPGDTLSIQHGASLADLQVRGDRILVGTRRWLAWYDLAHPSTPLWFVNNPAPAASRQGEPQLPDTWRPALAFGRLYTRAGETDLPDEVRAMDVADGRTLWKTVGAPPTMAGEASRKVHTACADPVIVGSCIYYPERVVDKADPNASRWDIVCAAADDGAPIWRSTLANAAGDRVADRLFRELPLAMRQRVNALTVVDGAVFFGHAGLAARLDARDGFVEWQRTYRGGMAVASLGAGLVAAPVAAPLVAGERVLFPARDRAALFAADRQTGHLLWEQVFVQPLDLLGATKALAIVRTTSNRLVGLSLATGAELWNVPVPADPIGRGTVLGDVVLLGSHDGLLALNAADGTVIERRACPEGSTVWNYVVAGKALVMVTDETAPVAAYKPDTILNPGGSPEKPAPLSLPFKQAWDLPCTQRTRVFSPPPGSPLQRRVWVAADGMLEAIDLDARGKRAWRRFTMGSVSQILFDKTTLVICSGANPNQQGVQAAMAINGQTGAVLWRLPVYQRAAGVTMSDGVFVMFDNDNEIRAYDAATGRQLWSRLVLRNTNMNIKSRSWPTPPLARSGQLHLFGARLEPGWEAGIPYPRFDLRTGALLPLRWIAKGEGEIINNIQCCVGTQWALIQCVIRKRDIPPRLYRCSLADSGPAQEVPGANRMWMLGGPYVVTGTEAEQNRKLLNCDDPAYEYPLDMPNPIMLTDGLLLQNEKDGVAIIDLDKKQWIAGINTTEEKVGNPRILKLDADRILFYGVSEATVSNTVERTLMAKEIDRRTGQVIRQGRVPDVDLTANELRGVLLPPQSDVLLVQDNGFLHAYVTEVPQPVAGSPQTALQHRIDLPVARQVSGAMVQPGTD